MKKTALALTFILALLLSVVAGAMYSGKAQSSTNNGTDIVGIISADTTWTKANSPYVFTGPVGVGIGVTLKIEPGVAVDFGNYYLIVNGTLFARGSGTDNIFFMSSTEGYTNAVSFMPTSSSWNEQTGSGCIIENVVFDSVSVGINGVSPKINNNTFGGGYFQKRAIAVSEGASPVISNNVINGVGSDSSVWSAGIGCRGNAFISDNIVFGWDSFAIYIDGGSPVVEENLVINNAMGFRIDWSRSTPLIRNNTIAKNSEGIKLLNGPWPVFVNNNFQDNNNYNIYLHTDNVIGNPEHDINATYNWWGTTNISLIDVTIRDNNDDFNLGTVNFVPFLTAPNPEAPAIPTSTPIPMPAPTPSPPNSPISTPTPSPSPIPVPGQSFFFVESNSTVSELFFNSTSSELSFTVNGASGTAGYVKVTIAKSLVSSVQNIKVYLDEDELNFAITSDENAWLLSFNYVHSTHHVNISLATNAAATTFLGIEYWMWIGVAIIIVVMGIGLLLYFKKRKR